MKLLKNKKGFTISDLAPLAVAFVAVAVALGLGLNVLGEMKTSQCEDAGQFWNTTHLFCATAANHDSPYNDSYSVNITQDGIDAGAELTSWLPTIALIVAAAVIIGIIVVYLARRFT